MAAQDIALTIAEVAASVSALRDLLDERDRSYIERFNAAERNVATAMTASEKAVTTAMAAAEKAVSTAMVAAKEAVAKQETANEKRFEGVNEFRQTLTDQAQTFARTDLMMAKFDSLEKRLSELTNSVTAFHAAAGGIGKVWGWIVGLAGIVIAAVSFWANKAPH